MEILFACSYNSVFRKNTNPFVKSLIEGMRSKGCSVDCDLHKFWTGFDDYDIIIYNGQKKSTSGTGVRLI